METKHACMHLKIKLKRKEQVIFIGFYYFKHTWQKF